MSAPSHHVYAFYDESGVLLYIGMTWDIKERFKQHARTKPWWPDVAKKVVEPTRYRPEAIRREQSLIRTLRPKYNVRHNPARAKQSFVIAGREAVPAA